MYYIHILGKVRGFFAHLVEKNIGGGIVFTGEKNTYEVNSAIKKIIADMLRTRILGFWGIFKVNKVSNTNDTADYYMSFNRFLKSEKPYVIYLENPTALCNYSLTCLQSPFVKQKLKKLLQDNKLKKIICMSKACETTAENVLGVPIPKEKLTQIYPYVPKNHHVDDTIISKRCQNKKLKLLYIVQGMRFYSKGGLEVIAAYVKLREKYNISLTIITNINQMDKNLIKKIKSIQGMELLEFQYPYCELEKIYASHSVLLQPSSDDSFGMTVLEGMKAGLPIIASKMYAFKEMVTDGVNGFLLPPAYYFFQEDDMPNPDVWNHRRKTIYSCKIDPMLVNALSKKIENLYVNRTLLYSMSKNSLERADSTFGQKDILNRWENIFFE